MLTIKISPHPKLGQTREKSRRMATLRKTATSLRDKKGTSKS